MRTSAPKKIFLLILAVFLVLSGVYALQVHVCRNKHCCKKAPHLLESLTDLLGSENVESSGCLSNCDHGPNLQFSNDKGRTTSIVNNVDNVATAIYQLQECAGAEIPKLLQAAAKVLERVYNTKDPAERQKFLNSVIDKLSEDESLSRSSALAHAHCLRAVAMVDQSEWSLALEDAKRVAMSDLKEAATEKTLSTAYRTWADVEQQREDIPHSKERVIAVLQLWHKNQPNFRSKIKREIDDLMNV